MNHQFYRRRDKFNRFDVFTCILGIVEAAMTPPSFIDGNPGGVGIFTAFRAARAFKLARAWKSLNKLLSAVIKSLGEILNFIFFLVLFLFIFSLLGMEVCCT
jgi:voltage-dependent calcium channel L type alpha-1D